MPGPTAPRFIICDRHGPPLESALVPLARTLFLFDRQLVLRVQKFHQKGASSEDEIRKAKAIRWIEDCNDIKQQWDDIESGQCRFSELYLKDNCIIPIWKEGMRIIKEVLKNNQASSNQSRKRDDFVRILGEYEKQANKLQTQMVDTAHRGLFDPEFLNPIQERWMRLDETIELHYDSCNRCVDEDKRLSFRRSLAWLVADFVPG
ncbi:hypothetical protein N0V94_002809 [Neodidymelliopsis sp. IMI 364377]|nr:hypothetical protein N0V94_002809 [Neodidymelliopsis sp. IMI 364377]